MTPDEKVRAFAHEHRGLIDRATAHQFGLSDRQIQSRVRSGVWTRRSRKVFALAGAPSTAAQQLLAATWTTEGWASHRSAGWSWAVVDEAPETPQITVCADARHQHPGIVVHRSDDLAACDLTTLRGLAITSIERTVLDLCAELPDAPAQRAIERALRLGLTRPDRLVARHVALSRRGRPGSARARRLLLDLDPNLAKLESDLEGLVLGIIRTYGLPSPTLQHQVQLGARRYRLDLSYPDRRLAIECDGFGVHSSRAAFEADRARQNDLVLAGWQILRFTWRQVSTEPDWVAAQIRTALSRCP